mgnify:CR=1 FL=1
MINYVNFIFVKKFSACEFNFLLSSQSPSYTKQLDKKSTDPMPMNRTKTTNRIQYDPAPRARRRQTRTTKSKNGHKLSQKFLQVTSCTNIRY